MRTTRRVHPLVSIVSVNWNEEEVSRLMLDSLRKVSYPSFETLLVDNGSTRGNLDNVSSLYSRTKLIRSEENLGFAGGNNLAFPYVQGKYILLLNNDTEVDPDFLGPMVDYLEENPSVGIVCPKLFFFDHPDTLQFAGATAFHPLTVRNRKLGYQVKDEGQFDEVREIAFANGACMLFRASLLEEVGPLYEGYFLYYEELDFCEKVKRAGYTIHMVPESKIFHKVSFSTGRNSPLKTYYFHRNRLRFVRRNPESFFLPWTSLYFWLIVTPRSILTQVLQGNPEHLKALFRSIKWLISHKEETQSAAISKIELTHPV